MKKEIETLLRIWWTGQMSNQDFHDQMQSLLEKWHEVKIG